MTFVKSSDPTKSKMVVLRLNEYESGALLVAAAKENETKTDWLMHRALSDDLTLSSTSATDLGDGISVLRKTYLQLARIDNNLNQLLSLETKLALFQSETTTIFSSLSSTLSQSSRCVVLVTSPANSYIELRHKLFGNGTRQFLMRAYPKDHARIKERSRDFDTSVNDFMRSIVHQSSWLANHDMSKRNKEIFAELLSENEDLRLIGIDLNEATHQIHEDIVNADIDTMLLVINEINRLPRVLSTRQGRTCKDISEYLMLDCSAGELRSRGVYFQNLSCPPDKIIWGDHMDECRNLFE